MPSPSHTFMRMYRQMTTKTDPTLIKKKNAGPEVHQVTTPIPITKHFSETLGHRETPYEMYCSQKINKNMLSLSTHFIYIGTVFLLFV